MPRVYLHVCKLGDYLEKFQGIMTLMMTSGLYEKVDLIYIGVLGENEKEDSWLREYNKVRLRVSSSDPGHYERLTLEAMREDSEQDDMEYLYLHTKGITKVGWVVVNEWIKMMLYFMVERHEEALALLRMDKVDVVGCLFNKAPVPHFSGNFWWVRSSHLRKLARYIPKEDYHASEFWILNTTPYTAVCMYPLTFTLYGDYIDSGIYKNMNIIPTTHSSPVQ